MTLDSVPPHLVETQPGLPQQVDAVGREEVLATLRSWTNLRAVKDPQSANGWKLEPGSFPGWAKLPEW